MGFFVEGEFACKCGCGKDDMNPEFMSRLLVARELAQTSFVINSGCRCDKYNEDVGSTSRNHVESRAADIACTDGYKRLRIVRALLDAGFIRIGIHKTFIHVDNMPKPASLWLY